MNSFRRLQAALLLLAALCGGPLAEAQDNSQEQNQTIRVSVDRVSVGVIVTDHSGHFVEGLRREDFHVFDNGTEQPLTVFAAVEEPAQVLLLIETRTAVLFFREKLRCSSCMCLNIISAHVSVAI